MDPAGFASPRPADVFPAGLRVLVVDDDPTWLKILEKMLKKCSYEVTTCNLAREALQLLRERKDGFDIVISDVNMPDMDGFKLLEQVGLEMDLPVIMMSVDGETSRVMKGVQHGACDYLLKPIRMKELRNIWQHVFRKRINEVREIEGVEEIQLMRRWSEQGEDGNVFSGDYVLGKRKKEADSRQNERVYSDASSSTMKKARVVWNVDLHQKFVDAVHQIGFEKAGPKKILDLMGVPWLTRENVASHLQKYRLFLNRLGRENEMKAAFAGTKALRSPSKTASSVSLSSLSMEQGILGRENSSVSGGNKFLVHNNEPKTGEADGVLPMLVTESRNGLFESSNVLANNTTPTFSFRPQAAEVKSKPLMKQDIQQPLLHHPQIESVGSNLATLHGRATEGVAEVKTGPPLFSITHESSLRNSSYVFPGSEWNTKALDTTALLGSPQRDLLHECRSTFGLWSQDFGDYASPDEFYPLYTGLANLDSFSYSDQGLCGDVPAQLCDLLKFETECQTELTEFPVMGQGLYIA